MNVVGHEGPSRVSIRTKFFSFPVIFMPSGGGPPCRAIVDPDESMWWHSLRVVMAAYVLMADEPHTRQHCNVGAMLGECYGGGKSITFCQV